MVRVWRERAIDRVARDGEPVVAAVVTAALTFRLLVRFPSGRVVADEQLRQEAQQFAPGACESCCGRRADSDGPSDARRAGRGARRTSGAVVLYDEGAGNVLSEPRNDRAGPTMGIMMGKSSSRTQLRRRRTWLCVVAFVASSLGGPPAGAATPTVPGAPTITSVKAIGLKSVTVAFDKPANDGGARIASYRATCTSTDRGVRGTHDAANSPIRVPDLTENKIYVCTVTASNDVGAGRASTRSSAVVVLPTPPSAPTVRSVKAIGSRTITVTFTKPADDGGAPIMNYRATCTSNAGGVGRSREGAQSPINVADLTAGEIYRCTVAADNRVGLGRASARSSPVLARPTAPGAPTITSVRSIGLRSIMVAFAKPADDGGTPIRDYVVECTSTNGGAARSGHASASPIRVSDLTSKKTYRCTVAATNDVRLGPSSPPSKPVVARF